MERNKIYHGNNLDILRTFPDNSIDSIVTDPPYGISFMNKKWDYDVPTVEFWREALRVLKHGGHALVACGTRTQHRMAVNLEDAGFEIRDIVAWIYGSGFPKSHDISKALDKVMGAERTKKIEKVRNPKTTGNGHDGTKGATRPFIEKALKENGGLYEIDDDVPVSDEAKQWQGWGTALKPAMELWTLCRKPLQGTVANNVLKYGVGGINIDGCRIDGEPIEVNVSFNDEKQSDGWGTKRANTELQNQGRFPANFIHDGSEEVVKLFPNDNEDSASRFFYTAKASQTERNWGLGEFEKIHPSEVTGRKVGSAGAQNGGYAGMTETPRANIHPTVKPIELMRYLVRLITPKGGVCLDPFVGSGTTAVACKAEKFDYIGCEIDADYVKISEARIKAEVVVYDIFDFT